MLVVHPLNGYRFVKANKSDTLNQLYKLIDCDMVQSVSVNPDYDHINMEIYGDEEGLFKSELSTNYYIIPFMEPNQATYTMSFGGPKGTFVVVSEDLEPKVLLDIVSSNLPIEDGGDCIASMQDAINDHFH